MIQTLDFIGKRVLLKKLHFFFLIIFLRLLIKYTFWKEDCSIGYNSMKSLDVHDIS